MPELPFGEPIFSTPFSEKSGSALIDELLLETGFKFLQETGGKILLE